MHIPLNHPLDDKQPEREAEHEEFAIAADLLDERGLDRAANALRLLSLRHANVFSRVQWIDAPTPPPPPQEYYPGKLDK